MPALPPIATTICPASAGLRSATLVAVVSVMGPPSAWLLARAKRLLPPRLLALAAQFDLAVTQVSVRNQRARWGSCATGGRISLNWRLIQTPDTVRDYVLIHELMHLRQPNHSARFWALVARACPDHQASRRWLRAHEAALLDGR